MSIYLAVMRHSPRKQKYKIQREKRLQEQWVLICEIVERGAGIARESVEAVAQPCCRVAHPQLEHSDT